MTKPPRHDDAELVGRVLAGQEQAFAALIERHADALSAIAFLITRSSEDARDVVQQAFFTAYRDLAELAEPERFGAWIKGIVRNLACKVLDVRTRRQRLLERLPHAVRPADPSEHLAGAERTREILRALETLDEPRREVAVLYYLQNMKVNAIGELVGRPAGSVKRMLAEARGLLRKELIDMAREEFEDYKLTDDERKRLAKIATFPTEEPKIAIEALDEAAPAIRAASLYGDFPDLQPGSEACFADYDYPGGKLSMVTHVRIEGPFDLGGTPAVRIDHLSFTGDGKVYWAWRPCYRRIDDDTYLCCAKQYGDSQSRHTMPLLTPDHPDWGEPQPKPLSLKIAPGTCVEPEGDQDGFIVDSTLHEVRIGKRRFKCIRRVGGGGKWQVDWSDEPVTACGTEEYFLADGRLLLWRRYNGMKWSEKNPHRKKDARGIYERLVEARMPTLDVFGETYVLWYDQIPDYAIR